MRTGLMIAALCMLGLAAGCGDDAPADQDLSTKGDMAHDLSASGTSCLTIITCAQACGASAPACVQACVAAGSSASQAKYTALFTCGFMKCIGGADGGNTDGGAGSCTSATDTSAACLSCTGAAAQSPACSTQLAACSSS